MDIIINDKNSFYFGRTAKIVETNVVNGVTVHRYVIRSEAGGEITAAIRHEHIKAEKSTGAD
jgi:hypothetical protein